jgi:hypothetical protein
MRRRRFRASLLAVAAARAYGLIKIVAPRVGPKFHSCGVGDHEKPFQNNWFLEVEGIAAA